MSMGNRRRLQRMVAVESRYFNRPAGISALIAITFALALMTFLFCLFYMMSRPISGLNESYLRAALYLMIAFVVCFFLYKVGCRNQGLTYGLVMAMSSICFITSVVAGYMLFRCIWNWHFSDIIIDPNGFLKILNEIVKTSLLITAGLLVVYVIVAFIPTKKTKPIFGRLWIFNVLAPLLCILLSMGVLFLAPREGQMRATEWVCMGYFAVTMWLALRYGIKAIFYLILQNDYTKETLVEDIEFKAGAEPAPSAGGDLAASKTGIIESIQSSIEQQTAQSAKERAEEDDSEPKVIAALQKARAGAREQLAQGKRQRSEKRKEKQEQQPEKDKAASDWYQKYEEQALGPPAQQGEPKPETPPKNPKKKAAADGQEIKKINDKAEQRKKKREEKRAEQAEKERPGASDWYEGYEEKSREPAAKSFKAPGWGIAARKPAEKAPAAESALAPGGEETDNSEAEQMAAQVDQELGADPIDAAKAQRPANKPASPGGNKRQKKKKAKQRAQRELEISADGAEMARDEEPPAGAPQLTPLDNDE